MIKFINMAKKNFPICNTATFTLTVFILQITKRSKEQYLDTLAACNYDKDLFLLESFSVAFSLLMIMLQTNSPLWSFCHKFEIKLNLKEMGKVNNFRLFLISKQCKCKQVFMLKEEFG